MGLFGISTPSWVKDAGDSVSDLASSAGDLAGDAFKAIVTDPIESGLGYLGDATESVGLGRRFVDSMGNIVEGTGEATDDLLQATGDAAGDVATGHISEAGQEFIDAHKEYLEDPGVQMALTYALTAGAAGPLASALEGMGMGSQAASTAAQSMIAAAKTGAGGGNIDQALKAGLTGGLAAYGTSQIPQFGGTEIPQNIEIGGETFASGAVNSYALPSSVNIGGSAGSLGRDSLSNIEKFANASGRGVTGSAINQLGRTGKLDLNQLGETALSSGMGGAYGNMGRGATQLALANSRSNDLDSTQYQNIVGGYVPGYNIYQQLNRPRPQPLSPLDYYRLQNRRG